MKKTKALEDWRKTHYTDEINKEMENKTVILMGWVQDTRDLGGIKFFNLRDSTDKIQITLPESKVKEKTFDKVDSLNKESVVGVKGKVKLSDQAPKGIEIIPAKIKILNYAGSPLPLDPQGRVDADLDTRLNARPIDLRRPKPNAIMKIKNNIIKTFRETLREKGFLEVNTPKIVGSATESGTSLFPIQYFDREAFLSQSPQLYKEVLTSCFEKIFEIGHVFRAEEHDTRYHLNEILSGDIEMAFVNKEDVMKILEDVVLKIFKNIKEESQKELKKLEQEIKIPEKPFPRITYEEAIEKLQEEDIDIKWGEDFSIPEQRKLGKIMKKPYFIIDWPTKEKPFYIKPKKENPELSHAFDLMYKEIELASGGKRIHQKDLLKKRIKENNFNPKQFEYHLKNFEWGMPPHAGWGLGLDRLLMTITNANNIRECVLFPRDRKRLKP